MIVWTSELSFVVEKSLRLKCVRIFKHCRIMHDAVYVQEQHSAFRHSVSIRCIEISHGFVGNRVVSQTCQP